MTASVLGCFAAAASSLAEHRGQVHKGDLLAASVAAVASFGVAGEIAAESGKSSSMPSGTFRVALIDAVFHLSVEHVLSRLRVEVL